MSRVPRPPVRRIARICPASCAAALAALRQLELHPELPLRLLALADYARAGLRRRGVPRELWDDALDQLPDSQETLQTLIRKKCRGSLSDPREAKRLRDALLRRGFSWEQVRRAMGLSLADGAEE